MKIVPNTDPQPFAAQNFTGPGDVQRLYVPVAEGNFGMATVVHHCDGSTSKPHSHAGGQYLFFVEGLGFVAEQGEAGVVESTVAPGTLVVTAPGITHWHGAAAHADATVFSVTWGEIDWKHETQDGAEQQPAG